MADPIAYGFAMPKGTDLIRGGDNAISTNAQRTVDLHEDLKTRIGDAEDVTDNGAPYVRGTLPADQSLDAMIETSWNGYWTILSANTNPGLPATPGVPALLLVENTITDSSQTVLFRFGGGNFFRTGYGSNWQSWLQTDGAFTRRGSLPADTPLSSLVNRYDGGMWGISSSRAYPDLPAVVGTRQPAGMANFTTGLGDTIQIITFRYKQGTFWRVQTSPTPAFTDWLPLHEDAQTIVDTAVAPYDARLSLLELAVDPITAFEKTLVFTTYEQGDAYLDWFAGHNSEKVEILNLGPSRQGRPIRAIQIGDPSKPTLYVIAAQHGDEPMGREVALTWARELAVRTDLADVCIVITPGVNVDKINVQRNSSSNTDLNRNWATRTTDEITATASVFGTHDVVLTIDAHEGGTYTLMQGIGPTAAEVPASLVAQGSALHDHITARFVAEDMAWGDYPGGSETELARNNIPITEKSTTYLFESPSLLAADMYSPSVAWRRDLYALAYDAVLEHFLANLDDYITAKQNA